jgi:signal transduction histidine kinase
MKQKLFSVTACFGAVILVIAAVLIYSQRSDLSKGTKEEQIIALNEISQLADKAVTMNDIQAEELLAEKIKVLQEEIRRDNYIPTDNSTMIVILLCGGALIYLVVIFVYIYFAILRPFDKLKDYAENLARGNFEIPLEYERSNYFGDFTWAFDHMRREITRARVCEQEAIDNNKTVIATLSHDIKTPIASIRTYAEGLEANMDSTADKRTRYLSVIMKKCDEVARLTNDLFLHSLSDLEKLKVVTEEVEICDYLYHICSEISGEKGDITFDMPLFTAFVNLDKNRFLQIMENLINNARKYAKTSIYITVLKEKDLLHINFKDYGKGVPDEDMPFLFDKFYRGKNCGDEQGSGLGLYIVRYILHQMKGEIQLLNHKDGLEAVVSLPLVSEH